MDCKCLRCHKSWDSKVDRPKFCPYCKSPLWNTPRKGEEALRLRIVELEAKIKELEKTPGRAVSIINEEGN